MYLSAVENNSVLRAVNVITHTLQVFVGIMFNFADAN